MRQCKHQSHSIATIYYKDAGKRKKKHCTTRESGFQFTFIFLSLSLQSCQGSQYLIMVRHHTIVKTSSCFIKHQLYRVITISLILLQDYPPESKHDFHRFCKETVFKLNIEVGFWFSKKNIFMRHSAETEFYL